MAITDATLCGLAAAAYTAPPTWCAGDVHAVRTDIGAATVVAFRGTVARNAADWLRDFDVWPVWHPALGYCHRGFLEGAEAVLEALVNIARERPLILTGHSLGGALAVAAAGLLAWFGEPPEEVVTFAAPRVGLWQLRRTLRRVALRQYRTAGDVVPGVPFPYLRTRRPVMLGPRVDNPLAAHSLGLYALRVTRGAA